MKQYTFKRNFYYDIEKAIKRTNITFLLGPRKCGKTVALLQFARSHSKARYHNFKALDAEESMCLFDCIEHAIKEDEDAVFLLDEITYAFEPEKEINKIAIWLSESNCHNVKIVFTGSQSVALEAWANRAFCGNATMIRTDFLSYKEWLSYKGIKESSEASYNQFLYEIEDFYGFTSLKDYLRGCLEETIISNEKTSNAIMENDAYLLDVDTLLDVCYTTLFTLHNHVNARGFSKKDKLSGTIRFYFRDVCKQMGSDGLGERIADSFIGRYSEFKTKDLDALKQAFIFLYRAGLITITPVSDSVERIPNLYKDLSTFDSRINYKEELFKSYNVCIKYPMFYMAILKDILKEDMPAQLPTALLGSIVECHVRGILPEQGTFEFQDGEGHEIDYVNVRMSSALEITVSNKRSNEVYFDLVPEYYTRILLTKDIEDWKENLIQIPYHRLIQLGRIPLFRAWSQVDCRRLCSFD